MKNVKKSKSRKKVSKKSKIKFDPGLPIGYEYHLESSYPYYDPGIGPNGEVVY